MLAYGVDMDTFLTEFRKCIQSIVVKQTQKASLYETAEIKRNADQYVAMMDGMTEWASFGNFAYEVLITAGLSPSLVDEAVTNKELIPYDMRTLCMNLQRQYVIDNYVEENNYYRMLNGLPSINDTEKDFITLGPNSQGLPESTPIHLMTIGQQDAINTSGLLNELLEKYPSKEYLQHLGAKKISPYRARIALNYQIIYMEKANTTYISNDFTKYYSSARDYVMRGLYNYDDRNLYNSYDQFMGFVILVMAINRVFAAVFKQGITREFYDDNLIRDLFACYNIPYEETIDLKYQRELAKKLNVLLQKKSSNNVLFDIKTLFNYNQVNIYQYYLMKDYRHDDNGDPIIIYKTIVDDEGNEKQVIDYESTYDIYFQKVNIASENKAVELTNPSNRVNYISLVGDDPYWINDSDLINKIYTNKFNSALTKYMSIDVAYDVSKLMYETCHTFRLIFDAYEDTRNIKIRLPYVDDPVSLYDTVTFLCALVCKKFSLTGEIPLEPWNVANVYGFNFKTDIEYLREAIVEDIENQHGEYSHVDPELVSYLKLITINSIEDVKKLYENIEELRVFLDTAMRLTQDLEAYNAYKKIYNSILVTSDLEEVYTKNNGEYAHTYMELLEDRRPDLAAVVRNTEEGNVVHDDEDNTDTFVTNSINAKLNKTLDILSDISEDLSDLRFASEKTEIVQNIEKIINQMKSYTVDMQSAGILYIFNDPHMCMLKILDYLKVSSYLMPDEGVDLLIDDVLDTIRISNKYSDKIIRIIDKEGDVDVHTLLKDMLNFLHRIELRVHETFSDRPIDISDAAANIYKTLVLPTLKLYLQEQYYYDSTMNIAEHIGINTAEMWSVVVSRIDKAELGIYDVTSKSATALIYMMTLALKEEIMAEVKALYKDAIKLICDIWKYEKNEELGLSVEVMDILAYSKDSVYDMSKKSIIRDFLVVQRLFKLEDYIWLRNKLMTSKSFCSKLAVEVLDSLGILARDAINQGIVTDDDFRKTIQVIIPSYLTLVNKLDDVRKNSSREDSVGIYDLFSQVLTDNIISEPPILKEEHDTEVKLTIRDGENYHPLDYLSAIQSSKTSSLANALASTRVETSSLSNDVLGVVYGLDGSVEVIGRNNTLEEEPSKMQAPRGIGLKDSVTITRN